MGVRQTVYALLACGSGEELRLLRHARNEALHLLLPGSARDPGVQGWLRAHERFIWLAGGGWLLAFECPLTRMRAACLTVLPPLRRCFVNSLQCMRGLYRHR